MIQLNPQEYFTITRQLQDPADTSTYYLRAYIRNAKTDELLDTVDLEDKGEQRFKKKWQVTADTSGEGFYITILVKVFTDSGYTTESMLYGRVEMVYLVQQRLSVALAGGGPGVSYKKIREIVNEEMKKLKLERLEDMPKQDMVLEKVEVDFSPVMKAIKELESNIPKKEEVDFSPIIKGIKKTQDEIKGIKIPRETDLSPVLKKLEYIGNYYQKENKNIYDLVMAVKEAVEKKLQIKIESGAERKSRKRREIFLGNYKLKNAFL